MTTETGALFLVHANRCKEALFDLIEDGKGILVSDGYGMDHTWVNRRQTCWAHLIRTARGCRKKPSRACRLWQMGAPGIAILCVAWPKTLPPGGAVAAPGMPRFVA